MKRLKVILMITALLISMSGLTGCGGDADGNTDGGSEVTAGTQADAEAETEAQTDVNTDAARTSKGLFMQVDKATGKMLIKRPQQQVSASMGEKGSWTIFVYLCGTDLESKLFRGGSATDDLKEMQAATANAQIRYVIQTGGTKFWHNSSVDEDMNQRFVIENGKLIKVDEGDRANMGKSSTLSDFLKWGVKNFSADKMGVVLWNHGGGSIGGVCYDEYEEWDSLMLRELDAALLSVFKTMTDKFDLSVWTPALWGQRRQPILRRRMQGIFTRPKKASPAADGITRKSEIIWPQIRMRMARSWGKLYATAILRAAGNRRMTRSPLCP